AVFAGSNRPAHRYRVAQIEGNPDVREIHLVHRQFIGVDQGEVDLPLVDHPQQVDDLDRVGFFKGQLWQRRAECGELLGVAAALEHHDALAEQGGGAGRSALPAAVDDLWRDI